MIDILTSPMYNHTSAVFSPGHLWEHHELSYISWHCPWNTNKHRISVFKQIAFLMAHNWQKLKSRFLTCSFCHKIYRVVEAVGLISENLKTMIFVKM